MKKSLIIAMAAIALVGLSANQCGGDKAEQKPEDQTTTTPPPDQPTTQPQPTQPQQ
jgi:hypothetical protein